MKYSKLIFLFLFSWFRMYAQQPVAAGDSTRPVEILQTRKLEFLQVNDTTELQILAGKVRLKQGNTLFDCDSCVINNRIHVFEAFRNVHIIDGDTADVKSDYLKYLTDKRIAYFQKNVELKDNKNGRLNTNELEYDLDTKIGIYTNGGTVHNKGTVITSQEGWYYAEMKDVYFKKNVKLRDPAYSLDTDSLLINTETEIAKFIARTYIKDSTGRTVEASDGYYDTRNKKAEFGKNAIIHDGKTIIRGDRMYSNDSTKISIVEGNAVYADTAQGTVIVAGRIFRNSETEAILATGKPLMIIKQEDDSIYIRADTLFSARLTDLNKKDSITKDTIKGKVIVDAKNTKDSTNRYFEAYRNVRIFSDSVQAVSDSAFYSFKDSVFRLFQDPVVWSRGSQITGDTILLFTKNKKADRIKVFENSLLVNKVGQEFYNQIKSARMDGFFTDGSIDSVNARGFAECIYYIQDEDSAFTGINQSTSDAIDVYFSKQELEKVVFRSAVKGTLWPMRDKSPQEMRLQSFKWLEARRPKTKYEMYE